MDLFVKAKSVRLRSYKDKYLIAEEDRENINQTRDGSSKNAIWIVELVDQKECIRLRSCFGTYLTASNIPFIPGVSGKKVIQTLAIQFDRETQWEPLRDGMQVRLRSSWGNFLRPNRSLPPWRNSVTHDVPHLSQTRVKLLWDVEVVEKRHVHRRTQSDTTFIRSRSRSTSTSMSSQNQNSTKLEHFF
ncbi:hypothetical protein ACJIZ3_014398 [Penstemon smallii]|uniref:DUF569 domain-containing protein n=1 Tax=Penstemon smallii TaxID=265156 RepID=A0ABD3RJN2_9LAMI